MKRHFNTTGMLKIASSSADAYQYISRKSPVHSAAPFLKVGIWLLFIAAALFFSQLLPLLAAAALCLIYYNLSGAKFGEFIKDIKFIFIISISIIIFYIIISRNISGIIDGAVISSRIFLLIMPMIVLLKTTTISDMLYAFGKVLPYRYVFAVTVALRFLPYFSKEIINIIDVQRMRGVNITWKTFLSAEALNSILIPLVIRAVRTADELSMSVTCRGFGAYSRRTYLGDFKNNNLTEKLIKEK